MGRTWEIGDNTIRGLHNLGGSVGWALSCQPNEDPSICSALRE